MRCRNCHTGMMDTDAFCPGCHAPADRAHAVNEGPSGEKPNGLWLMLPIFGGALGGLLYAGLVSANSSGSGGGRGDQSATKGIQWAMGLFLLLVGGLFLVLGFVYFDATVDVVQRVPKDATAAELLSKDYVDKAPGWIKYQFAESKPVEGTATRRRLGRAGEVQAKVLLVKVENRWLVTTVAPGFKGNELVGRIVAPDISSAESLVERVRKKEAEPSAVLPYEFNGVDGTASDQRLRFTTAGVVGGIGVVAFVLGLWLVCMARKR